MLETKKIWIFLCVPPLTFAEVDRHALGLEQAIVLSLGVALDLRWDVARWGLSERVRQGRHRRRRGWSWRGGGSGGVHLAVDWRDAAWAARYGWRDELPAKTQQAAGHLVDVEGGRFCTGARARKLKTCWAIRKNKSLQREQVCGFVRFRPVTVDTADLFPNRTLSV